MMTGRVNQKTRTRTAIVDAARGLVRSGQPVSMAEVAIAALVSEATAYRYFPDLGALLREAMAGMAPDSAEVLAPVAGSTDPVERVAFACRVLLDGVIKHEGAVRVMIQLTVNRPNVEGGRPGLRFGLIAHALAPFADELGEAAMAQLKRDLAMVLSADAVLALIDLAGATREQAVDSAVRIASTVTAAAFPDRQRKGVA